MTKNSVGLQLVTSKLDSKPNNIVIKSLLKSNLCFLNTCYLCKNKLHQDKDIYMYRDLEFCSSDCRERQLLIDERKELEISTKLMLAAYRNCNSGAGKTDNRIFSADFRRPRRHTPTLFIVP